MPPSRSTVTPGGASRVSIRVSGVPALRKARALRTTPAYSGSSTSTRLSLWSSMKAMVAASSRVFRALSTAPAIGMPKCASTIAGVFGSITATVSFLTMPRPCSALASRRERS